MAWTTFNDGDIIRAAHLKEIQDALSGASGAGQAISLTQLNDANYALDVTNLDSTNSRGLRVRDSAGNILLQVYKNTLQLGASAANDALAINANISGKVYLGDSANANMTVGLTINQGANDNEIFNLKSSDVAHAITTVTETDTYFLIRKVSAANCGADVWAFNTGGSGQALQLQGINYAAADTTKSTAGVGIIHLTSAVKSGTGVTDVGADGNLLVVRNNVTTRLIVDAEGTIHSIGATATDSLGNGLWFLNDTSNANMTLGLTINQGANDNEALALKSSDVAHGVTDFVETDTYATMAKISAADGGLAIRGVTEAANAIFLEGIATTDDTAKTTDAGGAVFLYGSKKSGTGKTNLGANANLVAIRNYDVTRFLFDAEGSGHSDVEWTTYDAYDDLALLNGLEAEFARRRDPVKAEFGAWLDEQRETLQAAKIVNFYDPTGTRGMVNWTRHSMLLTGAVRQVGRRQAETQSEVADLETRLAAVEAHLALLPSVASSGNGGPDQSGAVAIGI